MSPDLFWTTVKLKAVDIYGTEMYEAIASCVPFSYSHPLSAVELHGFPYLGLGASMVIGKALAQNTVVDGSRLGQESGNGDCHSERPIYQPARQDIGSPQT